jgi:TatD DNase family protein
MAPVLFDSHAHLMDPAFLPDLDQVLGRARDAGVVGFVAVGYDIASSDAAIALAARVPDVWATVGIHPNRAGVATDNALARLEAMARAPRVVAIGECGLDFYRDHATPDQQRAAFLAQLAIAASVALPVVVHSRDAMSETLDLLGGCLPRRGGVMHCFDGTAHEASRAVASGLHVSVAGPVTYRKDRTLATAIAAVPADFLLLETDCPYLGPEGFRGQRNEPSRVAIVAEAVARARNVTVEEVGRFTTNAACRLFGIEASPR